MEEVVLVDKIDFKKTDSYRAPKSFQFVEVPQMQYLMIDGHGDPNTAQAYQDALQTLYPVAYKLKFSSKLAGRDYVVPPLEGLWWAERMDSFTSARDKSQWDWTMMLMVPDWLGPEDVAKALGTAQNSADLPAGDKIRLGNLSEGRCLQVLHIGSYDDEAPVLARMHQYIKDQGLDLTGKHHEIYLSDPRRVQPEKLRTILRQPVVPAAN
ncbi:GyrI-like domain-containing protein [Glutamicibacter protophormiae]|uniref:GyrI-like domain-containing protein n=1 Tax=Glutamicibacter protophormiae TaxID=37930 RepID=UPI003A95C576